MEDGRGSSGIARGKSIGLAEGILLPAEVVDSNRSRTKGVCVFALVSQIMAVTHGTKWDRCICYHGVELDSVFLHIINRIGGQNICQLRFYKYLAQICTKFIYVQ